MLPAELVRLPLCEKNLHCASPGVAIHVASTVVHNASQWFMEQNAMPALVRLLDDADCTVRQKGLMSLSCLLRHNQPGLTAFAQVRMHPQSLQLDPGRHNELV